MTNGSVPPATDPPNNSSIPPTDGPLNEPSGTEPPEDLLMNVTSIQEALSETFKAGWNTARMTNLESPPGITWKLTVDLETRQLHVTADVVTLP